ncbi:MAG: DUF4124 domain-containing protein [Pseudomonadota bacterium]|nr:DUF4124 domain-containing protein [Pseudomonadota bacterium]
MKPWTALGRLSIALGLAAAFAAAAPAAVIYKWTDADGVVHYSDHPVPAAEKIVTSSSAANGGGDGGHAQAKAAPPPAPSAVDETAVFKIESPAKEQVFFGDELVMVRLNVQPVLTPDQSLTWQLNGASLADQGGETAFALPALPRGTYTLTATVGTNTATPQRMDEVTFYVRQPSALAPQHQKH